MPTVSSGILFDANVFNLKEIRFDDIRKEIFSLFVQGERAELAFMTIRDQVIFTNKRIIVANVQRIDSCLQ